MRRCGLRINFAELLDLMDVIGLAFNLIPAVTPKFASPPSSS
jgi:hypothetical protein